jgi:hypothetical protein
MKYSNFVNINSIVIKYSTSVSSRCAGRLVPPQAAGMIPLKINTYYDETSKGKFREKN